MALDRFAAFGHLSCRNARRLAGHCPQRLAVDLRPDIAGHGRDLAFCGWFWFRRRFVGLQETLEELREDLEWVKEGEGRGKGQRMRMKDESVNSVRQITNDENGQ